jgi:F-type H+-transporting ATPase subunit a
MRVHETKAKAESEVELVPGEQPIAAVSVAGELVGEKVEGDGAEFDPVAYYLDAGHLFDHVKDAYYIEVPKFMGSKWYMPNLLGYTKETPMVGTAQQPIIVGRLTKFMVLELVAALLIAAVFIWLARKVKDGDKPRGRFWNFLEAFVVFIRDEIAKPAIGSHDARRFTGFLLTIFFFVLALNLFGMIPGLGSATGELPVTGVLALITFAVVVGSGVKRLGLVGFLAAQAPHMELPFALKIVLVPAIWLIEMLGLFIKHFVLAIRLFANMFAGHLVLAVFIAFIGAASQSILYYFIGPTVVVGSIAFSLLELFVAFLQAYVFTFLAALFIGSAIHPH